MHHLVIVGVREEHLDHGGVAGRREPQELAQLPAHVIGAQLELLGSGLDAEVPGGGADDDALAVGVRSLAREAVGAAPVQRLEDAERRSLLAAHGVVPSAEIGSISTWSV